jgi:hypothetical protein
MKRPVCAEPQRGFRFLPKPLLEPAGAWALPVAAIPAQACRRGGDQGRRVKARHGPRGSHLQKLPVLASDGIPLCAVLLLALYVVPTGAHLAELPNKIGVPSEQYMLVQVYAGWNLFGFAGWARSF